MSNKALLTYSGRPISLGKSQLTIGRHPNNKLVLDGSGISRHHAVVIFQHNQWILHDNQSTHGTYVNKKRITSRTLRHGDKIRIGTATIVFQENVQNKIVPWEDPTRYNPLALVQSERYDPYPSPPPQRERYVRHDVYGGGVEESKPGKLQTIAILCLIDGIMNILLGVFIIFGLIITIVGVLCIPIGIYPVVLGILEIVYATKILPTPIKTNTPAKYVAVMQIINIMLGNVFSLIIGILSLSFYDDYKIRDYFRSMR